MKKDVLHEEETAKKAARIGGGDEHVGVVKDVLHEEETAKKAARIGGGDEHEGVVADEVSRCLLI